MTWLPGWALRKRIIIPSVHVDSDLVDFPFYVKIDDADFHEARADGFDIRFTLSDGTTLLEYEREHWTGGNGSPAIAHLWVKVPSILASGGAIIYVYYGKRDAPDGEDAPNVWDANFKGVWHFGKGSGMVAYDTSGFGNDGALINMEEGDWVDGKVGKCLDFDGDNDHVKLPNNVGHYTDNFTIISWFKTTGNNIRPSISRRTGVIEYDIYIGVTGIFSFYTGVNYSSGKVVNDGFWHMGAVVINGANSRFYVDGVPEGSVFNPSITGDAADAIIGAYNNGASGNFDGIIDEVRISNVVRADAWRKFVYHNINEADNEITWGIEEAVARGVQASREEPELLLTGIPKDIILIGKKEPIFISREEKEVLLIGRKKPVFISKK